MKPNYFESVQLLRGLAAMMVLFFHNFGWYPLPGVDFFITHVFKHGELGVSIFFVISGFVLPLSLHRRYRLRHFHIFLAKRAIRIEPTYVLSVFLALGILIVKTNLAPNAEPHDFSFTQFFAHFVYLIPFTEYHWYNTVYWTLAIEFQYYLSIALIFPLFSKKIGGNFLILVGFSALYFVRKDFSQIWLLTQIPLFAAGIATYLAYFAENRRQHFIYSGYALLMCVLFLVDGHIGAALTGFLTTQLILYWKPKRMGLRYFGDISYSLYVTHYPIVFLTNQTARHFWGETGSPLLYLVAFGNIALSILVAHLLFIWVEKPTQRLSKRLRYE